MKESAAAEKLLEKITKLDSDLRRTRENSIQEILSDSKVTNPNINLTHDEAEVICDSEREAIVSVFRNLALGSLNGQT